MKKSLIEINVTSDQDMKKNCESNKLRQVNDLQREPFFRFNFLS